MELRRYALLLWRWLWLIVLGTVLAAGAAYLTSRQQKPVYQASTMMLVSQSKTQIIDSTLVSAGDRLAATYSELLHRQPVLDEVIKRLDLKMSTTALSKAVKVQPIRNTQLIQVLVEGTNPQQTAAIANEIPRVFIRQNDEMQTRRFSDSKASLQKQMDGTRGEISHLQTSIAELQDTARLDAAEIDRQQRDLRELQTNYSNLYKSYEDLRLEEAKQLDTLLVTEEALAPQVPIRPKTMQNTLLAAVVGAMLALGVAYLIEYLDDTVKDPDEIEPMLALTTLAAVPSIDTREKGADLPVIYDSHSAATEAFRVLRTNLQFASVGKPLHALMVTSPAPSEGKSTVVANLGAALAQAGKVVVLVDTDLHRPQLYRLFKLSNNTGVTSALLDEEHDANSLLQETEVPRLRVLTSGPLPPNPAELLGTPQMSRLISQLKAEADIVILDTPPTMALADSAILASQVDGVLLVLNATHTRRELAQRAVAGLRQVEARLIGTVLNGVPTRGANSYYYYHYYSHYNYYNTENGNGNGNHSGNGSGNGRGKHRLNLTGNHTRNHTRNHTGNQPGNHTGNHTGTHTGNHTGNHAGNHTQNLTGNQTQNPTAQPRHQKPAAPAPSRRRAPLYYKPAPPREDPQPE